MVPWALGKRTTLPGLSEAVDFSKLLGVGYFPLFILLSVEKLKEKPKREAKKTKLLEEV